MGRKVENKVWACPICGGPSIYDFSIRKIVCKTCKWESEEVKFCEKCEHFIGAGDWNLCCDLPHPKYPNGFLCYEDTEACNMYKEREFNNE